MREVSYFSNERRAEKCSNHHKQNTVQSTGITREERQLRDKERRDKGGKGTELAVNSSEMVSLAILTYTCLFIMYVASTDNLI